MFLLPFTPHAMYGGPLLDLEGEALSTCRAN
jgi:hypothetical protein